MAYFSDRDTFRLVELKRDYQTLIRLGKIALAREVVLQMADALSGDKGEAADRHAYLEAVILFVTDGNGFPSF